MWGDVLREQKADESTYRYSYQGQFSEKDIETGWSHFELREYDATIGRWMITDPYGQYWSPYAGMGNDPVNSVDPSGGKGGPVYKEPTLFNDATVLEGVTVTAPRWTAADEAGYQRNLAPSFFNNFNTTVENWDRNHNDFGRWLENVMPKPKNGLSYFASGENAKSSTITERKGTADGFITNPGSITIVFDEFGRVKVTTAFEIVKRAIEFGKNVHDGIDKVNNIGEKSKLYSSPSVKDVHDAVSNAIDSVWYKMSTPGNDSTIIRAEPKNGNPPVIRKLPGNILQN